MLLRATSEGVGQVHCALSQLLVGNFFTQQEEETESNKKKTDMMIFHNSSVFFHDFSFETVLEEK